MKSRKILLPQFVLAALIIATASFASQATAQQHNHEQTAQQNAQQTAQSPADAPTLRLEELEQMTIKNNPTLQQAEAARLEPSCRS